MKYRLAQIKKGDSVFYQIQKKTWFGWIMINDPGQQRSFDSKPQACKEYEEFLNSKREPIVSVIHEDEV